MVPSPQARSLRSSSNGYRPNYEENGKLVEIDDDDNAHDDIKVKVANNGAHITLQFDSDANNKESNNVDDNNNKKKYTSAINSTTYHASWLWSNDPKRVLLPSGQRTCTPGQWRANGRPRVQDASIIHCNMHEKEEFSSEENDGIEINQMHNNSNVESAFGSELSAERIEVPGPTFEDCCHPLAVYGKYPAWISTAAGAAGSTGLTDESPTNNGMTRPYLKVVWSTSTAPSTTTSIYDIEWLRRFQYDDASRLQHRRRTEVQPLNAVRRDGPPLCYSSSTTSTETTSKTDFKSLYPGVEEVRAHAKDGLMHVNYHSIIGNNNGQTSTTQDGFFQLLHSVFTDGAAIVSNTPPCPSAEAMSEKNLPVAKVARAIGKSLSHGALYGNIFHVRVGERNSNNVAYTSSALCPHQDLAYYESPPGVQLLHCVAMGSGVVGGESVLIDAMAAAYRLREVRPESFEVLVKCPATFVKQRDGACMTYRRPHIVLAEDGGGGTCFDREIVAVYWSPPFEGPVCLPPGQVDRYYEAYADFERMLDVDAKVDISEALDDDQLSQYAREFTWEHKLNPGDMLVFNNRRMLHGRRGFSAAEGVSFEDSQRHLVGCYTNIDDTLNSYRVSLRERGCATTILNVGNGTNIIPVNNYRLN
mmetsp:Transcript_13282/g.28808  ORF Transcript_13282/g.28808 Transcript_13282/m.28808 type:complete len:644 (+) Transcript_13282:68-1999(+)